MTHCQGGRSACPYIMAVGSHIILTLVGAHVQVADALKERAERIYKQYGNVMMDVAVMS